MACPWSRTKSLKISRMLYLQEFSFFLQTGLTDDQLKSLDDIFQGTYSEKYKTVGYTKELIDEIKSREKATDELWVICQVLCYRCTEVNCLDKAQTVLHNIVHDFSILLTSLTAIILVWLSHCGAIHLSHYYLTFQ